MCFCAVVQFWQVTILGCGQCYSLLLPVMSVSFCSLALKALLPPSPPLLAPCRLLNSHPQVGRALAPHLKHFLPVIALVKDQQLALSLPPPHCCAATGSFSGTWAGWAPRDPFQVSGPVGPPGILFMLVGGWGSWCTPMVMSSLE